MKIFGKKTGEWDVFAHPVKKSGKIVGENNFAVVKKFYTQAFSIKKH